MTLRNHLPERIRRPLRRLRDGAVAVVDTGAHPVTTLHFLTSPNMRRAEPRPQRRLLIVAMSTLVIVVVAVAFVVATPWWWLGALLVIPFVAVAVRDAWRGRARAGADGGVPLGHVRRGPTWILRPDAFARDAARFGPVFKTNFYDVPAVCVVDLPAGAALLREAAGSLGPPWGPYERFVPGGSVRGSDGATHRELRQVFARALGPDAVRAWAPVLRARAEDCLATLADAGGAVNPLETVRTAVFRAWAEVMLGLEGSRAADPEVRRLVDDLDPDRRFYASPITDAEMEEGLDRLGAMCVAGARAPGAPDTLARRFDDGGRRALDEPAILRNLLLSVITTRDDVAGLLMWVLWYLGDEPQWAARVRAEGAAGATTAAVVSEVLRLEQSEFIMRRATAPVDHEGPAGRVVVPADWYVRVCIREIHRDDAVFPDADRFDPGRFIGERSNAPGRSTYAPFGIDHRSCLGEVLTRTFAAEFAAAASGYHLETVADGPVELGQQRHWSPSTQWRLRVTRADAP